mmetsp:Transcript_31344/g.91427  ORF Transcript_31344/g.91427 Transcript_31344/m.91427 type:complete len:239 (-) Transcript_31344:249-965(-)
MHRRPAGFGGDLLLLFVFRAIVDGGRRHDTVQALLPQGLCGTIKLAGVPAVFVRVAVLLVPPGRPPVRRARLPRCRAGPVQAALPRRAESRQLRLSLVQASADVPPCAEWPPDEKLPPQDPAHVGHRGRRHVHVAGRRRAVRGERSRGRRWNLGERVVVGGVQQRRRGRRPSSRRGVQARLEQRAPLGVQCSEQDATADCALQAPRVRRIADATFAGLGGGWREGDRGRWPRQRYIDR